MRGRVGPALYVDMKVGKPGTSTGTRVNARLHGAIMVTLQRRAQVARAGVYEFDKYLAAEAAKEA